MTKVIKSRRLYSKPLLISEEFVPDVYCAACYSLACDYGIMGGDSGYPDINASGWGQSYQVHTKKSDGKGCGHAANQRFRIDDSGKITVVELNAPNTTAGTELPCKFVGDIPTNATGSFEVTWTTDFKSGNFEFTYTHKGTIMLEEGRTGNHS